jgi:large subunit ribosomal protein L4e
MASRPTVSIATAEGKPSGASHPLPSVFSAPIRPDIVQYGSPIYNSRFEEEKY